LPHPHKERNAKTASLPFFKVEQKKEGEGWSLFFSLGVDSKVLIAIGG
jgi:hypothetical protein